MSRGFRSEEIRPEEVAEHGAEDLEKLEKAMSKKDIKASSKALDNLLDDHDDSVLLGRATELTKKLHEKPKN